DISNTCYQGALFVTRLLIATTNFSKDFLAKSQPGDFLFTGGRTAADFAVEVIAPEDSKLVVLLLRLRLIKFVKLYQQWEMLRQGIAWRPEQEPDEIHCWGILGGITGALAKSSGKVGAKLVLYVDKHEIDRHSSRKWRSITRWLLKRTDFVILETPEDRMRVSHLGESGSSLLVGDLLRSMTDVSCLYMHPERLAMLPFCQGRGIDVGCGSSKTHPDAIGVDLVAGGEVGVVASGMSPLSQADVCASGDNLPMFDDGSLDYVVARHNIEHYVDVVKTLQEWRRVLRPGGIAALVVPDDAVSDTLRIDPTHKHAFTRESFVNLVNALGGLKVREIDVCFPGRSFKCIIEKL
ncbi:MAG: methyltransferase domain-containing protein, partial [Dehalococcoidia bacterium]|nr:methyltransferase domain-containing protein [Dehalococcoidia bacterium]